MTSPPRPDGASDKVPELDQVVEQVVSDAHVAAEALRPEERQYLQEHALKKPMGVLHVWALGVGGVITGAYFGWNGGLGVAGPIGMLLASLFVCALYMTWVLSLSELAVAMPFAGGPLAYGRRAVGPWFGFVMGWSMFLECLFAAIGTAIATGGYIAFILKLFWTDIDERAVTAAAALATVALFAAVQWVGARQQAKIMEWMTYGAIFALIWFWIACIPGVRLERLWTAPLLPSGWEGVARAIPYAIWWLVIIELVALAAEETHTPHRTIPRGLALAQLTLIGLVVLTWFFASTAGLDYRRTGNKENLYPLPQVYREVWDSQEHLPHLAAFSVLAICGMIASYNGMLYAVSRQSFSLGRAGYLPGFLGIVHPVRRTPIASILFWSLVVAAFVVWNFFSNVIVDAAVLSCNLTALIWYVLAIGCLFILRKREPDMPRPYRVPLYPYLPAAVVIMSVFAASVYALLSEPLVLWLTAGLYALGLGYYFAVGRNSLVTAAPEELAARAADRS
ncbi:MAG TPA: amino acid permease [Gemmataceae bacterium]|nr:amino acid permease [Gemmataceae bacterium]